MSPEVTHQQGKLAVRAQLHQSRYTCPSPEGAWAWMRPRGSRWLEEPPRTLSRDLALVCLPHLFLKLNMIPEDRLLGQGELGSL